MLYFTEAVWMFGCPTHMKDNVLEVTLLIDSILLESLAFGRAGRELIPWKSPGSFAWPPKLHAEHLQALLMDGCPIRLEHEQQTLGLARSVFRTQIK